MMICLTIRNSEERDCDDHHFTNDKTETREIEWPPPNKTTGKSLIWIQATQPQECH